ncbi:transporter substrate-binding domain-containing protein [Lutibaculum baratangense]|uniref:Polar amino acid uptake family ABC transporter, periplasmic substrate-binding protein n=1 Tax=Lutibaculum baratangense AMV1 TaxID=631454 RepID=V4RJD5_9HYPH|nr:transporter substrate-binding domain-containing protein [Lutibaculum baratangense]ESR26211.1 Polar amino acid uptake family ABC transporter, periplasmic substrate- binding protein [Lutibaculum baratangense AMV1]
MIRTTLVAFGAMLALGAVSASADVMQDVKNRGKLVVGVKADYKPFGFRDPSGAVVGIEPDLAADVAERLGVELELVPVISANRIEFLQQGKIDLLIATMSDKPERRAVVQAIDPPYYSDSVNILAAKKANLTSWEDLNGAPLCATTGAWYDKDVAQQYVAQIVAFDGSEKPLFALQQGQCVGYLYDQTFIQGKLLEDQWKADFAMPLEGVMEAPWIIAVAQGEDEMKTFMEETTMEWMKDGTIIELEEKWGIEPTAYSKRMHEEHKGS